MDGSKWWEQHHSAEVANVAESDQISSHHSASVGQRCAILKSNLNENKIINNYSRYSIHSGHLQESWFMRADELLQYTAQHWTKRIVSIEPQAEHKANRARPVHVNSNGI